MSSTQEVGDIFGAGRGPADAMLRSPTVLIVAIGLWGMNIFFYRLFGLDYRYILNYDLMKEQQKQQREDLQKQQKKEAQGANPTNLPHDHESDSGGPSGEILDDIDLDVKEVHEHSLSTTSTPSSYGPTETITWYRLVIFSLTLLLLLNMTRIIYMDRLGGGVIGAVFLFYGVVFVYIFLPLSSTRWLRRAFWITMERTYALIHPRCWYFRRTKMVPAHMLHKSSSNNLVAMANPNDNTLSNDSNPALGSGDAGATTTKPTSSGNTAPSAVMTKALVIPRAVPFVDVFYADAMCSLSKVFFDWGLLLHMASHYPDPVPPATHNIVFPTFLAAIPFLIRARQCLLMFSIGTLQKDPKRYQHMANAIKYSTSIWPLMLSAYQKTLVDPQDAKNVEGILILLQFTNAFYALYWDIVMDWGMLQNPTAVVAHACVSYPAGTLNGSDGKEARNSLMVSMGDKPASAMKCQHLLLRPSLRYGLTMSALIVFADTVLRFSWLLRFVSHRIFVSNDAFVLCTQFLEVFRRGIWNLLRVEWENIKQRAKLSKSRDSLSDYEDNNDDESFDENMFPKSNGGAAMGSSKSVHLSSSPSKKKSAEQEMVSLLSSRDVHHGSNLSHHLHHHTATTIKNTSVISPRDSSGAR